MKQYFVVLLALFISCSNTAFGDGLWTFSGGPSNETWSVPAGDFEFRIQCSTEKPIKYVIIPEDYSTTLKSGKYKRLDLVIDGKYRFNNIQNTLDGKVAGQIKDVLERLHFAKQSIVLFVDGKKFNLPLHGVKIFPTYSQSGNHQGEQGVGNCYSAYFFKYGGGD